MRLWNLLVKDPGRKFQLQLVSCAAKLTEHCALAFHVRRAEPCSTPTLQLAPHFSSTGPIAAVRSVLWEHQATGKERKCVEAQNSLLKQARVRRHRLMGRLRLEGTQGGLQSSLLLTAGPARILRTRKAVTPLQPLQFAVIHNYDESALPHLLRVTDKNVKQISHSTPLVTGTR